jgi:phosphopantothenoylcysteine decarboxylase/phosphopantothenate--cysteine ligase
VLVIIGGGIAAYKSLDLIRRLRERGCHVRGVLTQAAQHFVTPLSVSAIADDRCATDLFDPQSEFDAGHIRLAREADLIIVAPATADLMAKIVHGLANDLATAILLARRAPLLVAPAMNPAMWANAATQRNAARLKTDGALFVGPNAGEMAESGEAGLGRMAEPLEIVAAAEKILRPAPLGPLVGKHVLITSGPTHEPIDPVRYIANRSSGKQGYALAAAAVAAGARVTLISGPVNLPDPPGAHVIRVEAARAMLEAVETSLPADVAIFAAAVADWRVAFEGSQKLKKGASGPPSLALVENPDILATIARRAHDRPPLVIGFAAETEQVIDHARAKLARKGCDWIVANDVSMSSDVAGGVMGSDRNTVHIIARDGIESWPQMAKQDVARALVARIAQHLGAPIPSGET